MRRKVSMDVQMRPISEVRFTRVRCSCPMPEARRGIGTPDEIREALAIVVERHGFQPGHRGDLNYLKPCPVPEPHESSDDLAYWSKNWLRRMMWHVNKFLGRPMNGE